MKTIITLSLALLALVGVTTSANAATVYLATDDFTGITFWLISMGMLAATAFFFIEQSNVSAAWRKSVTVAGLVTGIAFIHYMYLRSVWVEIGDAPTVYRYIDWFITIPLQLVEFYLILSAVKKVNGNIFWRILFGALVMLIGGYLGQAGFINPTLGFIIWITGWIYILYEIFSGEAGKVAAKSGNKALVTAFGSLRMIVTIGWAIYPLGYIFGYLTAGIDANSLNAIYNLADFINKIAFGLIIWSCAVANSSRR
jgi:bacteriorhodopsin